MNLQTFFLVVACDYELCCKPRSSGNKRLQGVFGETMNLAPPIPLRLSIEKKALYEQQAMASNVPLSTYLRSRLEREDLMLEEMQMLRRAVQRLAEQEQPEGSEPGELAGMAGVLLEILLTVRQIGGGKSTTAQKEIERLGYAAWRPEQ